MHNNQTILVIDYAAVEKFFRSCARMMEMQKSIEVKWVPYKDSAVLNAIYTVFFWKEGPGIAEADVASISELKDEIEATTDKLVQGWFNTLAQQGPAASFQYVRRYNDVRNHANQAMQSTFNDVRQINADIAGDLATTIKSLAAIRLGATIGVAVIGASAGVLIAGGAAALGAGGMSIGLGANGLAFAGVGLTSSVSMSVVKTWESGETSKAVAIDFSKAAVSEGGGTMASAVEKAAGVSMVNASRSSKNAVVAANRYSDLLGRKTMTKVAKYTGKLNDANQIAQTQSRIAAQAGGRRTAAAFIGKALPVVFAAWDIHEGIKDYKETVNAL